MINIYLKLIVASILLLNWSCFTLGDDAKALTELKISFKNAELDSNWTGQPCIHNRSLWKGISCSDDGNVSDLILENMGLTGSIDGEALGSLTGLRRLSFQNNSLSGRLPDISGLVALKAIYFSFNMFSDSIPENLFKDMRALKKLWLCNNTLSGSIPLSLTNLDNLIELELQNNDLTGTIPAFNQTNLRIFSVANNGLEGSIPDTRKMQSFGASSFSGNSGLCGKPLNSSCAQKPKGQKLKTWAIVVIVVADALALLIITLIFAWYYRWRNTKKRADGCRKGSSTPKQVFPADLNEQTMSSFSKELETERQSNKLMFFNGERPGFDLEDMLRASAELLGKGNFGTAYKAVLDNGSAMVVKRLRELNNLGKVDFENHMKFLGSLRHPNLLPLKAYFFAKEEKLLVYDCMPNGSLLSVLHGKRAAGLDWKTRLKIIRGVARGLAYLHGSGASNQMRLPHGHLKSSNILLDNDNEPLLSDYALAPLIIAPVAAQKMVAYRAPEFVQSRKLSPKADVWSFGVLLLEILTGKPSNFSLINGQSGTDLPLWVNSVVREEWTGEVFDRSIPLLKGTEGQMLQCLQIALWCVEISPDKRPSMADVLKKIEQIRDRDVEDYSSNSEFDGASHSYENTSEFSFNSSFLTTSEFTNVPL